MCPYYHAGKSSGYMPRSGIAGSSGRIMSRFLMSFQTDFSELLYQFAIHKQLRSIPLFIHLSQQLLYWIFDIIHSELWEVKFQVCLICISLMTKIVEHFFGCFSPILYPSGENVFVSPVTSFEKGYFILWSLISWIFPFVCNMVGKELFTYLLVCI